MKPKDMLEFTCSTCPEKAGRFLSPFILLLLRVVWGWQLTEAGWGKLHDIPKTAGFFSSLGIPAPEFHAYLVGAIECGGGALLIVGLASRLVSIPLLVTMVVAAFTAEKDRIFGTLEKPVHGFEAVTGFFDTTPGPFIVVLLVILAFGPGLFSFDSIIRRCCAGEGCSKEA